MIDFKLLFMYTRIFQTRLIVTIYLSVVLQVLLYSMAVHFFWEANAPNLITPVFSKGQQIDESSRNDLLERAGRTMGLLQPGAAGAAGAGHAAAALGMLLLSPTNDAPEITFTRLESASSTPTLRSFYEGKRVRVIGRFEGSETFFRLKRFRINCCAADAQPINVTMMLDPESKQTLPSRQLHDRWVEVIGEIRFAQARGQAVYQTVLLLRPTAEEPLLAPEDRPKAPGLIRVLPQSPANPFIQ